MSNLRKWGTKSDRYAYKRMMTGLTFYLQKKRIVRFLTLTGANNEKGFRRNLDKLCRIIRRRFGKFEYFAVRTNEGQNGVLHILYVGKSFKYKWLKETWEKITGFWSLHISSVRDFKGIGFEMTRQNKTVRYSQSRGWYKGIPDYQIPLET